MNTPAHLIMGLAGFGQPGRTAINAAAITGALLPDLSLYLLVAWHLQVLDTPPGVVFGQLYFSEGWQGIFRIDNSMVLWGIALVMGLVARWPVLVAFAGAAMIHLGFDFLLHHDDGRAHFWPISNWIFESPFSYWDGNNYGNIIGPLEIALSLLLCALLWRRFRGRAMRGAIVLLGLAECLPVIAFGIMFAAG